MILDKTRRNRRFRFTAETYPVGKVRPEGLAAPANRCGPSDPLVGGLPGEGTDQGLGGGSTTQDDGSRTSPRTVVVIAWGPEGRLGDGPELFSSGVVRPRAGSIPPEWLR